MKDMSEWSQRRRETMVKVYGEQYVQDQWRKATMAILRYMTDRNGDLCMEEVQSVHCPTLIIHGQKDTMVAPEYAEHLHNNIPGSRLVLWPEGKHSLHLRYSDEFNRLVEQFLDEDK